MKPIIIKVNSPRGFAAAKALADALFGGNHHLYSAERPAHVRVGSGSAFTDNYGYECDLEYYNEQLGGPGYYTPVDLTESPDVEAILPSVIGETYHVTIGKTITAIGCNKFSNRELLRLAKLIEQRELK